MYGRSVWVWNYIGLEFERKKKKKGMRGFGPKKEKKGMQGFEPLAPIL